MQGLQSELHSSQAESQQARKRLAEADCSNGSLLASLAAAEASQNRAALDSEEQQDALQNKASALQLQVQELQSLQGQQAHDLTHARQAMLGAEAARDAALLSSEEAQAKCAELADQLAALAAQHEDVRQALLADMASALGRARAEADCKAEQQSAQLVSLHQQMEAAQARHAGQAAAQAARHAAETRSLQQQLEAEKALGAEQQAAAHQAAAALSQRQAAAREEQAAAHAAAVAGLQARLQSAHQLCQKLSDQLEDSRQAAQVTSCAAPSASVCQSWNLGPQLPQSLVLSHS